MKVHNLELSKIKPYDKNPRINDQSVPHVARSIQEFGFQQPIVVDKNHVIIVGHTRYLAAQKLELKFVPVIIAAELSAEKAKAYRLTDNRTAERSEWNEHLLLGEITELTEFYSPEFLDFQDRIFEPKLPDDTDLDDDPIEPPKADYKIVVVCTDEESQQELFIELRDRGLKVKI